MFPSLHSEMVMHIVGSICSAFWFWFYIGLQLTNYMNLRHDFVLYTFKWVWGCYRLRGHLQLNWMLSCTMSTAYGRQGVGKSEKRRSIFSEAMPLCKRTIRSMQREDNLLHRMSEGDGNMTGMRENTESWKMTVSFHGVTESYKQA